MNRTPSAQIFLLLAASQFGLIGLEGLRADPSTVNSGGTLYLKDAGDYINTAPILPKIAATPTPSPKPTGTSSSSPSPAKTRIPKFQSSADEDDEVKPARDYPPAIIHRSSMTVGQQIPVPTQYLAPQVVGSQNGSVTVVPATPTSFQTVQTGVTTGTDASGNTTVRDTELSGMVNYGQPIRTVAPVYDSQGRRISNQVITVSPNPVLVPVTQTIEIQQSTR